MIYFPYLCTDRYHDNAMTPAFRDPLLWLRRFRKRRGYGVHSPFAFSLLEDVVYESLPYYAFKELDAGLEWRQRFRVRRYLHLLFRLTNYQHPSQIILSKTDLLEKAYLTAACPGARVVENGDIRDMAIQGARAENPDKSGEKRLIFLGEPDENVLSKLSPDTLLLLANVHRYKDWWDSLPKVVGFDLYDLGIAFFDPKYNKQDYIVNF